MPSHSMHRPAAAVLALGLMVGSVAAVPALAQDPTRDGDAPLQAAPSGQADTVAPGTAATDVLWYAETLMGRDIVGIGGDSIGKVDDMVINVSAGTVHVLVDVGGVLGIGEQRVAIDLAELAVGADDTLVLDATPEQVAQRPQYRFPESPLTGAVRPGPQLPQTAAGIGDPRQGPQFVPGMANGPDTPPDRQPTATRPNGGGDEVHDDALAEVLRAGRYGLDPSMGYDQRTEVLHAAEQSLEEMARRIEATEVDADTAQSLEDMRAEAAARFDALAQASPEAWSTAQRNFLVSLSRLDQQWQQAQADNRATSRGGQASGQTQAD